MTITTSLLVKKNKLQNFTLVLIGAERREVGGDVASVLAHNGIQLDISGKRL